MFICLYSLVSSRRFVVDSLGVSMQTVMPSASKESFFFLFSALYAVLVLFFLLALTRTSDPVSDSNGQGGPPCLVLSLYKESMRSFTIQHVNCASQVAQWQRIFLPMQELGVQSLGWVYPLEKGMATHSRILAWEIPWTEEPGMLQSMVLQRSWT